VINLKHDFTNRISTEEEIKIAETLWENRQMTRKYGEMEGREGIACEAVETYLRFLKSVRSHTIIKFVNVCVDDKIHGADIYYVCLVVPTIVVIIVHEITDRNWYVSNPDGDAVHDYLMENF
jgi:hypothetical protein